MQKVAMVELLAVGLGLFACGKETASGLPRELPFVFARPAAGEPITAQEAADFTAELTGFLMRGVVYDENDPLLSLPMGSMVAASSGRGVRLSLRLPTGREPTDVSDLRHGLRVRVLLLALLPSGRSRVRGLRSHRKLGALNCLILRWP